MISDKELFQKIIKLSEEASKRSYKKFECINSWCIENGKIEAYNDVLKIIIDMSNGAEVEDDV